MDLFLSKFVILALSLPVHRSVFSHLLSLDFSSEGRKAREYAAALANNFRAFQESFEV